jgi:hypothetical protein
MAEGCGWLVYLSTLATADDGEGEWLGGIQRFGFARKHISQEGGRCIITGTRRAGTLMPRLLPRLATLVHAQSRSSFDPFDFSKYRPRRPKSLHGPTLPSLSFDPKSYPQSILLRSDNPIAAPDKYLRNKTLPPRVYVPKDARKRAGEYDIPRQMTREERKWWSSPYRMSNSTPHSQSS